LPDMGSQLRKKLSGIHRAEQEEEVHG